MKIRINEICENHCKTIDEQGYDFFKSISKFEFSDEIPIIYEWPVCPPEVEGKCGNCPLEKYCGLGEDNINEYKGAKCFSFYLPEIQEYLQGLEFVCPVELVKE